MLGQTQGDETLRSFCDGTRGVATEGERFDHWLGEASSEDIFGTVVVGLGFLLWVRFFGRGRPLGSFQNNQ